MVNMLRTMSNAPLHDRIAESFDRQRLLSTLGARLIRVADGEVEIELPWTEAIQQQHGFVHAGAIATIADSASGYACLTRMPEGSAVLSVEFKINLLAPAVGDLFMGPGSAGGAHGRRSNCRGVRLRPGEARDLRRDHAGDDDAARAAERRRWLNRRRGSCAEGEPSGRPRQRRGRSRTAITARSAAPRPHQARARTRPRRLAGSHR
jgi:uncharacterized protein (TIGR00369 family)